MEVCYRSPYFSKCRRFGVGIGEDQEGPPVGCLHCTGGHAGLDLLLVPALARLPGCLNC